MNNLIVKCNSKKRDLSPPIITQAEVLEVVALLT